MEGRSCLALPRREETEGRGGEGRGGEERGGEGRERPPTKTPHLAGEVQLQLLAQGHTRMLTANLRMSASQLCCALARELPTPPACYALYHAGKPLLSPLLSPLPLSSLGISHGSLIELKLRGRGGGCSCGKEEVSSLQPGDPFVPSGSRTPNALSTVEEGAEEAETGSAVPSICSDAEGAGERGEDGEGSEAVPLRQRDVLVHVSTGSKAEERLASAAAVSEEGVAKLGELEGSERGEDEEVGGAAPLKQGDVQVEGSDLASVAESPASAATMRDEHVPELSDANELSEWMSGDGLVPSGWEMRSGDISSIPAGLSEVYSVNWKRSFPAGSEDPRWRELLPLVELIIAAMEPISIEMAADLLGWTGEIRDRVVDLSALLFPVREGLFHVFDMTIVHFLTGEIAQSSSLSHGSPHLAMERCNGHGRFADGFMGWLGGRGRGVQEYWLQHGVVHLCRAGRAEEASRLYSSDITLLQQRADKLLLPAVATDYLELTRCEGVDLAAAEQMRRFVGKYKDVLHAEGGGAVAQLASQQPDRSAVFEAWRQSGVKGRYLKWLNKPQQRDSCIALLPHPAGINTIAISARLTIGGCDDGTIYVYDAVTEKLLDRLDTPAAVLSVAIGDDGKGGLIAAGCRDGAIHVWDAATLKLKGEKQNAHSDHILSLAISPDGKSIASGARDNSMKLWDAASLELKNEKQSAHSNWIASVAFSPNGNAIVSGSYDNAIKVWDAATLQLRSEEQSAHSWYIVSVAFSPDGRRIVSASWDNAIKVWDAATLMLENGKEDAHTDNVTCATFSPDGTRIVSTSYDKMIKVWDTATLQLKCEKHSAHSLSILSVAFSSDGKSISTGSRDSTIKVWEAATLYNSSEKQSAHGHFIASIAFSPDGKMIVSGSLDNAIKVWDAATLELKSEKQGAHTDYIRSVSFSPDGRSIVSGSNDKAIRVWDAATLELKSEKQGAHTDYIPSVAFSPDGSSIVSGSRDNTIKVWDAATLQLKGKKQSGHRDWITTVAFSSDGATIVSASSDTSVKMWNAETLEPAEQPKVDQWAELVETNGSRLALKGGGVFYAPQEIQCTAVHWPLLMAGGGDGGLYHLQVEL